MIILYHANCNDGSASALAAWLKLGDQGHQYIPVSHGKPPPSEVIGKDVLMLDFCYPRETLIKMAAKSIVIIDHHLSAQNDLTDPFTNSLNISPHFDMTKSGAVLSWMYFFPGETIPRLFNLVQDRDIWTNEYPESVFLSYGLNIFSEHFRDWKILIDQPHRVNEVINDGKAIYRFIQIESEKLVANRHMQNIAGFTVPVINAPNFLASDALQQILDLDPSAPFAASYIDLPERGLRSYSLRSTNDRQDVSVIASKLGGGGHRNAAAFFQPFSP